LSGAAPKYSILFTGDALTDASALDGSIRNKLKKVLMKKLAGDPEGYGLPLRAPLQRYWKHEFAAHRVIYRIYEDRRIVVICAVGPRKQGDAADVYRRFQALAETGKVAHQIAEVLGSFGRGKKETDPPKR
jgi:mRNA interferase RelE/StbE